MKKIILIALAAAVMFCVPLTAFGATEFTLGGYIKMETIWDTTQVNKNLLQFLPRTNDPNFNHGRLKFTAENTRMNFTIKGPEIWGAKTTAFIEWDFDNHGNEYIFAGNPGGGWASPHKARLGLRHAIFKMNWTDTEVMLGQYWSLLTEEVPETANFGACTTAGQPFLREPQIRVSQAFDVGTGKMTASLALSEATNGLWGLAINGTQAANNPYTGESSEVPKVTGRLKYDIDLWGKAAFWGAPRPLSMRVGGAWWRERFRPFGLTAITAAQGQTFGQNQYNINQFISQVTQQYMDHWMVEGSVFIPVIPTTTKDLSGTASLLTQWFVGAGLDGFFEDFPGTASYLVSGGGTGANFANRFLGNRELMKRFGGYVQAQYYFTNQIFMNLVYGMNRAYGVDMNRWIGDTTGTALLGGGNDPVKLNQQAYATVWYQPIKALKFGLEYTFVRTDYFQRTTINGVGNNLGTISANGVNHRMMACGFLFF